MRAFLNGGILLGESSQLYFLLANYGDTEGRYRFFYRLPDHVSLQPLRAQGYTGLPGVGITPVFWTGFRRISAWSPVSPGLFGEDMTYDFSIGYGENELDYVLNNTINPALGLGADGEPAQRNFDVGALGQGGVEFECRLLEAARRQVQPRVWR